MGQQFSEQDANAPHGVWSDDVIQHVAGFITPDARDDMRTSSTYINHIVGRSTLAVRSNVMTPRFLHTLAETNKFLTKLSVHINDDMRMVTHAERRAMDSPVQLRRLTHLVLVSRPIEDVVHPTTLSDQVPSTPMLLLEWAPQLQILDIESLNARDVRMMRGMGQRFTPGVTEVRIRWQHIQWIRELDAPAFLDNINSMHVTLNPDVPITQEDFRFLYVWATTEGKVLDGTTARNRKLWLVIPHYTRTINDELRAAFCASFDQHRVGLSEFHLTLQNVDSSININNALIGQAMLLFACSNTHVFLNIHGEAHAIHNSAYLSYSLMWLLSHNIVCKSMEAHLSFVSSVPIPNHDETVRVLDTILTQFTAVLTRSVRYHTDPTYTEHTVADYTNSTLFTLRMNVHLHPSQRYAVPVHRREEDESYDLIYLLRNEMISRGKFTIVS